MRVLVVEDETALADAVARGLRRHGMNVDVAYDGDDGYDKASATPGYDVLVLDRDLPGMSGDDICVRVTTAGTCTRVLMLTASTLRRRPDPRTRTRRSRLRHQTVLLQRPRQPSTRPRRHRIMDPPIVGGLGQIGLSLCLALRDRRVAVVAPGTRIVGA